MSSIDAELAEILADPTRVNEIPADTVLQLVGELERLKAILWAKLLTPRDHADGKDTDDEGLLKIEEVAELLGVPKGYVYDLTRRGELPSVRFGKYVRVEGRAIQEWIKRHREGGLKLISTSRRLKPQ